MIFWKYLYIVQFLINTQCHVLWCIEVKVTKDKSKYFTHQEIDDLRIFSGKFGAHPMVAIKFIKDWHFLSVDDLRKTDRSYVANVEMAQTKGLSFDQLLS